VGGLSRGFRLPGPSRLRPRASWLPGPSRRRPRAAGVGASLGTAALLGVAALPGAVLPAGLTAQGELTVARARIDATREAAVRVELDYTFRVDSAGAIPFEGLAFRPTELRNVEVRGEGRSGAYDAADFGWGQRANGRLTGSLPLGVGGAGSVRVRLSYDVAHAREGEDPVRVRIPILAPVWSAPEATPGVFAAAVLVPSGWTVFETFPSGLERGGDTGTLARYTLDLPAVPALLSLRATAGTPPLGGIVQFLDGLMVAVLGALALAAWVHFRRPV